MDKFTLRAKIGGSDGMDNSQLCTTTDAPVSSHVVPTNTAAPNFRIFKTFKTATNPACEPPKQNMSLGKYCPLMPLFPKTVFANYKFVICTK